MNSVGYSGGIFLNLHSDGLKSTELISETGSIKKENLPFQSKMACAVKLKDNKIMLLGGVQDGEMSASTWILDLENEAAGWEKGPQMMQTRAWFGCGYLAEMDAVVAFGNYEGSNSTEILQNGTFRKSE